MMVADPEFCKIPATFFQLKIKKGKRSGGSENLASVKANVHR